MIQIKSNISVYVLVFAFLWINTSGSEIYRTHKPASGNVDFILHEASDFPPLKPAFGNSNTNNRRDFVSPSGPLPGSNDGNTLNTSPKPSGKRDYVNPAYQPTTEKSTEKSTKQGSRFKDLINFFGGKKDSTKVTGSTPSSILPGTDGKTTPISKQNPNAGTKAHSQATTSTKKPISYSSVVSGPNKPDVPALSTPKPNNMPIKPQTLKPIEPIADNKNKYSTPSPSRPLPSSFVNRNNNTGNTPSDIEIQTLSEELLRKDTNNAAKLIRVNYQEKTTSQSNSDNAPLPLLDVPESVWNIPTIQKLVPLLDNYERDTLVNEYVTPQERNEENAFMDAIMSTAVIRHLMNFFKSKGYVTPDPKQQRDFLKQLWFSLYSRGHGKLSSSGFEHVFVSELKNGEVSGLHNWIYFYKEEAAKRANYLGYLKYLQLNDKGAVLKHHFTQQGVDKPVDTLFIGTSPELEIALYTLCFVTRADKECKLKLAGKDVYIVTYTFRYRSKNMIGSAYPRI